MFFQHRTCCLPWKYLFHHPGVTERIFPAHGCLGVVYGLALGILYFLNSTACFGAESWRLKYQVFSPEDHDHKASDLAAGPPPPLLTLDYNDTKVPRYKAYFVNEPCGRLRPCQTSEAAFAQESSHIIRLKNSLSSFSEIQAVIALSLNLLKSTAMDTEEASSPYSSSESSSESFSPASSSTSPGSGRSWSPLGSLSPDSFGSSGEYSIPSALSLLSDFLDPWTSKDFEAFTLHDLYDKEAENQKTLKDIAAGSGVNLPESIASHTCSKTSVLAEVSCEFSYDFSAQSTPATFWTVLDGDTPQVMALTTREGDFTFFTAIRHEKPDTNGGKQSPDSDAGLSSAEKLNSQSLQLEAMEITPDYFPSAYGDDDENEMAQLQNQAETVIIPPSCTGTGK